MTQRQITNSTEEVTRQEELTADYMDMLMEEQYEVTDAQERCNSIILTVVDKMGNRAVCHLELNHTNRAIEVGDSITRWYEILMWTPSHDECQLFDKVIATKE